VKNVQPILTFCVVWCLVDVRRLWIDVTANFRSVRPTAVRESVRAFSSAGWQAARRGKAAAMSVSTSAFQISRIWENGKIMMERLIVHIANPSSLEPKETSKAFDVLDDYSDRDCLSRLESRINNKLEMQECEDSIFVPARQKRPVSVRGRLPQ
jgi:hypothetical protein